MLLRFIELLFTQSLPAGFVFLGTGLILYWLLGRIG